MSRRVAGTAVGLAVALCLAGGCAEDESPGAAAPAREASTAPETDAAPSEAPPAGSATVEVRDGRVTARGSGVSGREVLSELAKRAGFTLALRRYQDRPVDLDFRDATLPEVLAALLVGDPYVLDYRVDEATGASRLARVRVGPGVMANRQARAVAPEGEPRPPRRERRERRGGRRLIERLLNPDGPEVRARRREVARARAEERAEVQAELIERLDEPDAADRLAALTELDVEGAGLEWAAYLAESDPSVEVRRAAVERLGEEGSFGAMTAVVVALDDPEPEVVVEALRAIDMRGDPSMLPIVQPLLDHPDPQVRKQAGEVVEILE